MLPFEPGQRPALEELSVFISAGRRDPFAPAERTERLAQVLADAGAEVTLRWDEGGRGLDPSAVTAARGWMDRLRARSTAPG